MGVRLQLMNDSISLRPHPLTEESIYRCDKFRTEGIEIGDQDSSAQESLQFDRLGERLNVFTHEIRDLSNSSF